MQFPLQFFELKEIPCVPEKIFFTSAVLSVLTLTLTTTYHDISKHVQSMALIALLLLLLFILSYTK